MTDTTTAPADHPSDHSAGPAAASGRDREKALAAAAAHFGARLAYAIDPADLAAARAAGRGPLVVDTRSTTAWDQGHLPGALHLPGDDLARRAGEVLPDRDAEIVVYCWGPGCDGSTKAALALTRLGYLRVRELLGGFEYWAREGLAVEAESGRTRLAADPLTAPSGRPLGAARP